MVPHSQLALRLLIMHPSKRRELWTSRVRGFKRFVRTASWLRPVRRAYRLLVIRTDMLRTAPERGVVHLGSRALIFEGGTWETANALIDHNENGEFVYEPRETSEFISRIDPGNEVLDIGAHIGYFSIVAASQHPSIRVYAFEMLDNFAEEIRRHALNNGVQNQIEIVPVPVGRPGESIGYESFAGYQEKPAVGLDDFCSTRGLSPKVIKMDIEGGEVAALQHAVRLLSEVRPFILLGFHPPMIERLGSTPSDVLQVLHDHRYTVNRLDGTPVDPKAVPKELCTLVCVPSRTD